MAMPTPNSTPASTRFEPPSPKAKVRPATTMATSERPRAIVLVKAVIKTLTAFSQGELPCANAGAAKSKVTAMPARFRAVCLNEIVLRHKLLIRISSFEAQCFREESWRVLAASVGPEPPVAGCKQEPLAREKCLGRS